MKEINIQEFVKMCYRAEFQTDNNDHSRAIMEALKFFGYSDLICILSTVILLHDRKGSISSDLMEIRKRIRETMYINVFNDYGKDILNELKKCF